jgi:tRNA pseudouridine13 synthase
MELGAALEGAGVELDWRAARLLPDDFCWQFCDDGTLQLDFALGAGGYATALVVEFVHYKEGRGQRGIGSERG